VGLEEHSFMLASTGKVEGVFLKHLGGEEFVVFDVHREAIWEEFKEFEIDLSEAHSWEGAEVAAFLHIVKASEGVKYWVFRFSRHFIEDFRGEG